MIPVLLAALLAASPDECRDLFDSMRYREAVESCLAAVPAASGDQLVNVYRVLGLSLATVGDERAPAAFASLLALEPKAQLPSFASPKLRSPFTAAQRGSAPVLLTATLARPAKAGQALGLEVEVKDGDLHPVSRVRIESQVDEQTAARAQGKVSLELAAPGRAGPMNLRVLALDRFGGTLAHVLVPVDVAPLRPPRPVLLSWKVWGIGSLLLGAGAAGAGIASSRLAASAKNAPFADDAASRCADRRRRSNGAGPGHGDLVGDRASEGAMRARLLFAALMAGCLPSVQLEGKACAPEHPCPGDLTCNPFTLVCGHDRSCPYRVAPQACAGQDYFVSPDGSDLQTGMDRSAPVKSAGRLRPLPGDRIHLLPGTYSEPITLAASGSARCPITLSGEATPGVPFPGNLLAKVTARLVVTGSHWTVSDLAFEVRSFAVALLIGSSMGGVTLARAAFSHGREGLGGALDTDPCDIHVETCPTGCEVTQSRFETPGGNGVPSSIYIKAGASGFSIQGNTFVGQGCTHALAIVADKVAVAGNDFSGLVNGPVIDLWDMSAGSVRFTRNVVHDITGDGRALFARPTVSAEVVSNTFVSLRGTTEVAASISAGTFADNLVSDVQGGTTLPRPVEGAFNLFARVPMPYGDSTAETLAGRTDQVVPSAELMEDFSLGPTSPAIDAADPALSVPAGGGARADIGALEKGAMRLPDGAYCLP